jgi:hypothetical protein
MPKRLPPQTTRPLSPPANDAFPYVFFENVAEHPFQPNDTALNLRNAWWLMEATSPIAAHSLSGLLHQSGHDLPLPGFLADHAPINYAIVIWNCYEASRSASREPRP